MGLFDGKKNAENDKGQIVKAKLLGITESVIGLAASNTVGSSPSYHFLVEYEDGSRKILVLDEYSLKKKYSDLLHLIDM